MKKEPGTTPFINLAALCVVSMEWTTARSLRCCSNITAQNVTPPMDEAEVISIVESVCQHPAEVSTNKSGKRLENSPLYWFQFNTREWFSNQDIAMMNAEQTGWYIRLKAFAWDQGGFLPADHDKLSKLAKGIKGTLPPRLRSGVGGLRGGCGRWNLQVEEPHDGRAGRRPHWRIG